MLRRLDSALLFDRAQSTVATAIGLCLLVAALIYLVPRQARVAAAVTQARQAATFDAAAELRSTDATPLSRPATPATVDLDDRTVGSAAPSAMPTLVSLQSANQNSVRASFSTLLTRPVALDTATILVGRGKVRLVGIDAVPLSRRCGEGKAGWLCGVEARTQFRAWLRARSISCDVPPFFGRDTQEIDAACSLAGEDIGAWLVRNGWATAKPNGPYGDDETRARSAGLGVWAVSRTTG